MSGREQNLCQVLHSRQHTVSAASRDAVLRDTFVALPIDELTDLLDGLIGQVVRLVLAPQCAEGEADAVGARVARLARLPPEALGRLLEVLGLQLTDGLPADDLAVLHPRLTVLLARIAAGFLPEERGIMLADQDALHAARQRAENGLRLSEARYRAVVTQVAEGIVLVDASTVCIREANAAFQRMVGYRPEDIIGLPYHAISTRGPDGIDADVQRVLRNGRYEVGRRRIRRRDGSLIMVEASATRIVTEGGALICVIARDITDQIEAEAELDAARRGAATSREAERARLALELHDGVVQELAAARYHLLSGAIQAAADQPVATLPRLMDDVQGEIMGAIRHLRELVAEMSPAGMDEFGLSAALENYVLGCRKSSGRSAAIELDIAPCARNLPDPAVWCLFRVAQEALRNAVNHGRAGTVVVRLRQRQQAVILRVSDDGCGFDVPRRLGSLALANHYGLVGMAERVAWANGRLRIRSRRGRGTIVTVWVPAPDCGG